MRRGFTCKVIEKWLEKLAPEKPYSQYMHNGYEDNHILL